MAESPLWDAFESSSKKGAESDLWAEFDKANPPPGLTDRLKQGFRSTVAAGKVAITDDPQNIAGIITEGEKTRLPPSQAALAMQEEIKPYAQAAEEATGPDAVGKWAILAAKRFQQFVANPREFAGMIAENLPNSAPGMAGMIVGGVGGTYVAGPVGGVVGSIVGGTAGGYGIEQGSAMIEQVTKGAQAAGINLNDTESLAQYIKTNYPDLLEKSRLKGIGTAGTDAILNRLTLGLAGMGERTLVRDAKSISSGMKAGTVTANEGAAGVAELQAKDAARNTLGAKAARGGGVVTAEMGGEMASEAAGQALAYGKVDPLEVIDEGLVGIGQGAVMAAGRGTFNRVTGSSGDNVSDAIAKTAADVAAFRAQEQRAARDAAVVDNIAAAPTVEAAIAAAAKGSSELPEITSGVVTQEQQLWVNKRIAQEKVIADRQAQLEAEINARREADYSKIVQESRLPAAEFDVAMDQRTGAADVAEAPNAMQLAFQKAQERLQARRGGAPVTPGAAIDALAHEAATSTQNDIPQPTDAQKEAGNYKKGHVKVGGLDISVENPAGSKRRPEWPTLESHYGYVKGVPARAPDKEHVDVFVKPGTTENYAGEVFVVDQNHADGKFDEPKVMIGFASLEEARAAYMRNYTKGWESRVRGITPMSMDAFNSRLNDPNGFAQPQTPTSQPPQNQPVLTQPADTVEEKPVVKIGGRDVTTIELPKLRKFAEKGGPRVKPIAQAEIARREEAKRVDAEARAATEALKDTPSRDLMRIVVGYGGINKKAALDVAGDKGVGGLGTWARAFKQQKRNRAGIIDEGHGLDEIAVELERHGYMTRAELESDGSNIAAQLIRDAIAGQLGPKTEAQVQKAYEAEQKARQDKEDAEAQLRAEGLPDPTPDEVKSTLSMAEAIAELSAEEMEMLDEKSTSMTNDAWESYVIKYVEDKRNANQRPDAENVGSRQETGGEEAGAQSATERRAEGQSRVEKRADAAQRKRVAEMSDEEKTDALLTDHLTGLHNDRWLAENIDDYSHVIAFDADSLKWVNDNMGHASGDALLKAWGEALKVASEDTGVRAGGDEFFALANSMIRAESIAARVQGILKNAEIDASTPGGDITINGIGVSFGIGTDREAADAKLNEHKKSREAAGERSARGEQPPGVTRKTAQGQQDQANQGERQDDNGEVATPIEPAEEVAPLELASQSPEEAKSEADAAQAKADEQASADRKAEEEARAEREKKEIAQRSEAAADDFTLTPTAAVDKATQKKADTQEAERQLSGSRDLFAQPANTLSPADLLRAAAAKMDEQNAPKGEGWQEPMQNPDNIGDMTFKVKPPKKLYRGVTGDDHRGFGTFMLGRGIYSSKDKSFAAKYGDRVIEIDPAQGWPRNPLVINYAAGGAPSVFTDWLLEQSGEKNIREFNKKWQDPGEFVRSKGYDGVIVGDEVVRYPDEETKQPGPPSEGRAASGAPAAQPKKREAGTEVLTDFGEKIEGARKDMPTRLSAALSDDDIATQPFSKVWPASDVDAIEDKFAAAIAHAARAEVPAKPRVEYKLKRWVEKVKTVRGLAQMLLDGKFSRDEMLARMASKPGLKDFQSKVLLLESIDRDQWGRIGEVSEAPDAYRYVDGKQVASPMVGVRVDNKFHWLEGSGSISDHVEKVNELLGKPQAEKKMQFEVRGRGDSFSINKKGDPERRKLKTFTTTKEAFDYIHKNYNDLVAAWDGVKERDNVKETDVRGAENRPRTAEDYRKGKDVTPEQFTETFGFRGVQFGNWVAQGKGRSDRQGAINETYDALMDLSNIIGVPPKALSLNGTLGLAFGARGSGAASAHYESSNLVINLTKTRGAGTLAHEWFHALDNYFSHQRGGEIKMERGMSQDAYRQKNYITYRPEPMYVRKDGRGGMMSAEQLKQSRIQNPNSSYFKADQWQVDPAHPDGVRPEVEKRFAALVDALDKSPMKARALTIDKAENGYWSRIIERAARSFENYVIAKMMEKGYHNDYLANVNPVSGFKRSAERYPYLLPEEVAPVAEAFDDLFGTIETRETDTGTAMFSDWPTGWASVDGGDSLSQNALNVPRTQLPDGPYAPAFRSVRATIARGRDDSTLPERLVRRVRPDLDSLSDELAARGSDLRSAERVADFFGHKAVFIEVTDPTVRFGGFASPQAPNAVFVNIDAPRPAMFVVGHELLHRMKDERPDLYTKFTDAVSGLIRDQEKFVHTLADAGQMRDELLADFSGWNFTRNEFWQALAEKDRSTFGKIADYVLGFIDNIIAKFKSITPQTDQFFTDVNAARDALADAFTEFKKGQSENGPLFSRKAEGTKGISVTDAQATHDRIARNFSNMAPVTILNNPSELPAKSKDLRDQIEESGAMNDVEAAYYDGEIFVFADNLASEERLETVLFEHEVTHYGLRGVFGKDLNPVLNGLMARNPELRKKATAARERLGLDSNVAAVEEVLADMPDAELMQLKGIDKFISAIRDWLAKHGFIKLAERMDKLLVNRVGEQAVADALVGDIVRAARDFARNGKPERTQLFMGGTRFAGEAATTERTDQTQTPAFRKWFGDSKVVDAQGKPLVVYHGTQASFNIFSEEKQGTTVSSEDIGFFFTNNPVEADAYAMWDWEKRNPKPNVMPVYLSIKNPLRVDITDERHPGESPGLWYDNYGSRFAEDAIAAGYDGLIISDMSADPMLTPPRNVNETLYVVFKPEQIKSAIGNRGTFDAGNPDIRFSRAVPGNSATWDAPEPSKMDNVVYALQDKHIDTRRVVQAIKEKSKNIADAVDTYLQEELFHGRTAKLVDDFLSRELNPLMMQMGMRGIKSKEDIQAFEKYLHARHAQERNEQIAKVNPDMPDGGSGMDTKDAQDYLANLDPKQKRAYEALAAEVDKMNVKTRQLLVDYGLESQATVDAWGKAYKHYVPLQREDMEGTPGTGQGFAVKGSATKRATGSKRNVVDILANLAMQREKTIVRGEKNKVANALVGLATANPNEDFWVVDQPPKIKYIDPRTGLVAEAVDPLYKSRENVVTSRLPDAAGNIVEHAVIFDEGDERAVRMAKSLKNLDMDQLGEVLGSVAKVTRYFASINTQYNPIFGVVNITRDTQGAMFNLSTTPIAGKQAEVFKHTLSALKGIYIDLRDTRAGKEPTSEWAQLFEEFQKEGGQTGYRDLFRTSKDRGEALVNEINRAGEGKPMQIGRAIFDWLSDYNTAMENAVRLASYKVAKESGMSNQRSASLAKNLTVNFNRKGQVATQTGALYAFFNASAQGTARLVETLKGPMGKKIIAGGITLGAVQALALAAAGFDDDEPPEFVRERNLIIPIGGKKYLTLPMPLGLHFIPNLGRIPAEFVLSGFKNPAKRIGSLFNVFADAFNPVGNAGLSLQTITPTVIDPLAALAENKDWTGKPIARKDFGLNQTPGHTRAKDTASAISKAVSQGINWVSGGTDYKPGYFSPTPDQLDFLVGQITGGLGREAMKVEQTIASGFSGEELPPYKIPLVGRFFGDAEAGSSQAAPFYNNLKTLNEHEAEIKGRRKHGEPLGDYMQSNPEARLFQYGNMVERKVGELRKQKRMLMEKDAPREQIKAIEDRTTAMMKQLNERVRSVQSNRNLPAQ